MRRSQFQAGCKQVQKHGGGKQGSIWGMEKRREAGDPGKVEEPQEQFGFFPTWSDLLKSTGPSGEGLSRQEQGVSPLGCPTVFQATQVDQDRTAERVTLWR